MIHNSNSSNDASDTSWGSWFADTDNIVGIDFDNNINTCNGIQIDIRVNIYADIKLFIGLARRMFSRDCWVKLHDISEAQCKCTTKCKAWYYIRVVTLMCSYMSGN